MPPLRIRKQLEGREVEGRLEVNPAGFGFVVPQDVDPQDRVDIYIAAANIAEAMHGDRVLARVERETPRGLEGRIIRVVKRAQDTVVGRFDTDANDLAYVIPFDRRIKADIQVPTGQSSAAEPNDMVVVQITRWPTATRGRWAPASPCQLVSPSAVTPLL